MINIWVYLHQIKKFKAKLIKSNQSTSFLVWFFFNFCIWCECVKIFIGKC